MRVAIDKAGRIVIPAPIRKSAGLRPGAPLDITRDEDGSIRIVRKVPGPKLVREGKLLVVRPTVPKSQLPKIDVAALLEEERNRWPFPIPPFSTPASS